MQHVQAFTFLLVKGTLKITVSCPLVNASMWAEITLCGHHLRPSLPTSSPKKKNKTFFFKKNLGIGQDTQNEDNDTGEQTRETTERETM